VSLRAGVSLATALAAILWVSCATGPTLPPLPPVPDISGPPFMAKKCDAGCVYIGGVLERDDAGAPRYRTGASPCSADGGAR